MGGFQPWWNPVGSVWCELQLEKGHERIEAGRLQSAIAGVLKVRSSEFTRSITSEHRAVIAGAAYNILSNVCEDRRGKYQTMVVQVGVAT